MDNLLPALKVWERTIVRAIRIPKKPKAPFNFQGTNKRGGVQLSWNTIKGADGYEILRSDSADFSAPATLPIRSGSQLSYFDSIGGEAQTKYYKVRATAGTDNAPFIVKGLLSGIISVTSIDSTDTTTTEADVFDTSVTDAWQVACVVKGTNILALPGGAKMFITEKPQTSWVVLYLEGGRKLISTPGHIIFTENGMVPVALLKKGTRVITRSGLSRVQKLARLDKEMTKLCVSLKGHLFWANGILSHNLKRQFL